MITVEYGYKLVNGHEFEGSLDLASFQRFCRANLRGMRRDGSCPRYCNYDVSALYCKFSDGRIFLWQRHYVSPCGRHVGGWQTVKTMPYEAVKCVARVS